LACDQLPADDMEPCSVQRRGRLARPLQRNVLIEHGPLEASVGALGAELEDALVCAPGSGPEAASFPVLRRVLIASLRFAEISGQLLVVGSSSVEDDRAKAFAFFTWLHTGDGSPLAAVATRCTSDGICAWRLSRILQPRGKSTRSRARLVPIVL